MPSAAQLKADGLSGLVGASASDPVLSSNNAGAVPQIAVSSRLFTAGVVALSVLSGSSLIVCLIIAAYGGTAQTEGSLDEMQDARTWMRPALSIQ